jgi:transposase-like protein
LESRYTELLKSIGSLESRSSNEIQGSINSLIQTSKSETNYLTHKLETLLSKLNNLENNMNLIESRIKQKFDNYNGILSREFEMRLNNLDKIKIHKGRWNFNNFNISRPSSICKFSSIIQK